LNDLQYANLSLSVITILKITLGRFKTILLDTQIFYN